MFKIYIVAETYQEFRNYCFTQGIPLDGSARYISRADQIHNLAISPSQIRFVGNWQRLNDAQRLTKAIHAAFQKEGATP